MGTFSAAGVYPALPEHRPQWLHRHVYRVPRRHTTSLVRRTGAHQPHRRVEEQQHPAGGGQEQRRFGAQQVLQIQT